jgi:hypothetical protein
MDAPGYIGKVSKDPIERARERRAESLLATLDMVCDLLGFEPLASATLMLNFVRGLGDTSRHALSMIAGLAGTGSSETFGKLQRLLESRVDLNRQLHVVMPLSATDVFAMVSIVRLIDGQSEVTARGEQRAIATDPIKLPRMCLSMLEGADDAKWAAMAKAVGCDVPHSDLRQRISNVYYRRLERAHEAVGRAFQRAKPIAMAAPKQGACPICGVAHCRKESHAEEAGRLHELQHVGEQANDHEPEARQVGPPIRGPGKANTRHG